MGFIWIDNPTNVFFFNGIQDSGLALVAINLPSASHHFEKAEITQLLGVFIWIYGIEFPTVEKVDGDDWVTKCYGNCLLQYVGFLNPYHGKRGYTPTIIGSDQKKVDIYGISTPWRARVSTWKTGVGWSIPSPKINIENIIEIHRLCHELRAGRPFS